jgi:hypothetical protein
MVKKQLVFVAVIIAALAVMGIYALTHPGGVSIQGSWSSNTILGSSAFHYEGTVFNNEKTTAKSVQLTLRIYDSSNFLIKSENVDVGDIPAQSSKSVKVDVQLPSFTGVSRVDPQLIWNP